MRRASWSFVVVSALTALIATIPTVARAQEQEQEPAKADKSNSHFDLHENKAGDAALLEARGRMQAGDCAGALTHFDQALKTAQDPEVRRDRGMCHDKLGNKYPALEDLRAYIAAKPDAPDVEQLRGRVQQLEAELDNANRITNSARAHGAAKETDVDVYAANRRESGKERSAGPIGAKPGEQERDFAYYKRREELADEAEDSPLRYGKGVVVAAFIGVPRYFIVDGSTGKFGYMAGGRLGYSTGKLLTLYAELGLGGSGTQGDHGATTGPITALGAEARFGLTDRASDQVLVRAAIGYEHYTTEQTRAIMHVVPGRIGVGYRHLFGPAIGLEVLLEGGPGVVIDEDGNSQFLLSVAGNVGFVVGF